MLILSVACLRTWPGPIILLHEMREILNEFACHAADNLARGDPTALEFVTLIHFKILLS